MTFRKIDDLSGRGKVLIEDASPGEVEYRIEVYQKFHESRAGEVPGLSRIEGRIRGGPDLLWQIHEAGKATLCLDDGRRLDFLLKQSSIGSDEGQVSATSDFYTTDLDVQ